jgi:hypothetical protein
VNRFQLLKARLTSETELLIHSKRCLRCWSDPCIDVVLIEKVAVLATVFAVAAHGFDGHGPYSRCHFECR